MATWSDVRRLVGELPDTDETTSHGDAAWTVRGKSFAWERPLRKGDLAELGERAPAGAILGIRTADLEMKDALLGSDPKVYFTTSHFDGYAAVLIVLANIRVAALRDVLLESWLTRAPKKLADAMLLSRSAVPRSSPTKSQASKTKLSARP